MMSNRGNPRDKFRNSSTKLSADELRFRSMSESELNEEITSVKTNLYQWRESMWSASQANRARGVITASRQIDHLVEQKRMLERIRSEQF